MENTLDTRQVERLIRLSREKPLLPETFVPWQLDPGEADLFLPEKLNSLEGHPFYAQLDDGQKRELGRHEVVQVMYSYAWSEGLFCVFMNRYILDLLPDNIEYRFLVRELQEEFRHQDMFATVIQKLEGRPILPGFQHRFWGKMTVRHLPADLVFLSGIAVELITDVYGKVMRQDPRLYEVLRKISELHHIEEGRHIAFTEMLLRRYTERAGFLRRSLYSVIVLLNIYFMRTLYVKREIYDRIGAAEPDVFFRAAMPHFKEKFAATCLDEAIVFVQKWNGFNWLTRPLWRLILGVHPNRLH